MNAKEKTYCKTGHRDGAPPENADMLAALRASESRYRRLFESAQDGILILDAEAGMITDANSYLLELLGHSHEDEKSLRVTCGLFLKSLGYHVVVAETPDEALKLTARHPDEHGQKRE